MPEKIPQATERASKKQTFTHKRYNYCMGTNEFIQFFYDMKGVFNTGLDTAFFWF